mmetsp:Transcript_61752/g.108502  ORF Transcript_61752/g.108502 Transcript_61752/m.108502 type:complete len:289 (+) Transcript_61752:3217-4083(+)
MPLQDVFLVQYFNRIHLLGVDHPSKINTRKGTLAEFSQYFEVLDSYEVFLVQSDVVPLQSQLVRGLLEDSSQVVERGNFSNHVRVAMRVQQMRVADLRGHAQLHSPHRLVHSVQLARRGVVIHPQDTGDEFFHCTVRGAGVIKLFSHFTNNGTQRDVQLAAIAVRQLVQFRCEVLIDGGESGLHLSAHCTRIHVSLNMRRILSAVAQVEEIQSTHRTHLLRMHRHHCILCADFPHTSAAAVRDARGAATRGVGDIAQLGAQGGHTPDRRRMLAIRRGGGVEHTKTTGN